MGYTILNPQPLKQIGTICISKKDNDYRPLYALDENDVALGGNLRIGSTKNYSQPQFIKGADGSCIYNPLFHTFLCKQMSKCTLLFMSDDNEWLSENKIYFHDLWIENKPY